MTKHEATAALKNSQTLGEAADYAWQKYDTPEFNENFGTWFGGQLDWEREKKIGAVTMSLPRRVDEVIIGPDLNFKTITIYNFLDEYVTSTAVDRADNLHYSAQ